MYYQGRIAEAVASWRVLAGDEFVQTACDCTYLWQGVQRLADSGFQVSEKDIFEFNRLFIGPGKLPAPPYEGAYRNQNGLIMQQETLDVRRYYERAGLAVKQKNCIPDDKLELELEFVCYLLSQAGKRNRLRRGEYNSSFLGMYRDFYVVHLSTWVEKHCQAVITHASTGICHGMALIMLSFFYKESQRSSYKEEKEW
jgi:TorA maturation chaperone TorD